MVVLACLVVTAACADDHSTPLAAARNPTTTAWYDNEAAPSILEPPPPVTVRSPTNVVTLDPWTYCYGQGCADGVPPTEPLDIGHAPAVTVDYPLPGWNFTADFSPAGVECPRVQTVALEPNPDGTSTLTPAGHAGTYDVTLWGRGDGDLYVTFRWTTPRDGPLPEPDARLAIVGDGDGSSLHAYGVGLMLSNLATTPTEASATITVRSEGGDAVTFAATRASDCLAEGTVYWDGPDEQAVAAAALGPPPFTYDVDVVLDGSRHTATATWPDDEVVGNEPNVALEFAPPLPAVV